MIPQILGALGGAYGAYAATPEGENPDVMSILTGAGTGAINPVTGISSGVLAGVGELTDSNENTSNDNPTENTAENTAVGNVSNAITSQKPKYAGNGNGVNNSLNPAFGKPSINQKTQDIVKTQMSADDQAKTMLNIA